MPVSGFSGPTARHACQDPRALDRCHVSSEVVEGLCALGSSFPPAPCDIVGVEGLGTQPSTQPHIEQLTIRARGEAHAVGPSPLVRGLLNSIRT